MKNFFTMGFDEIRNEVERFQIQIMQQQQQKKPITPAQLRRWKVLHKAYKAINAEYAK